jgi:hypothetical protein
VGHHVLGIKSLVLKNCQWAVEWQVWAIGKGGGIEGCVEWEGV